MVSSSLEFDLTTPLFNGGQEPTIVFNAGSTTPSAELLKIAHVIQLPDEDPSSFATNLIAKLFELGLRKVTCEGGPSLLAQLLKADAINEYDLTISPLTVGGTPQWPDALPKTSDWVEVGSAISGDFEFKRLLRS
jgi:riboflavin biosynthesis pyrimidine reductase